MPDENDKSFVKFTIKYTLVINAGGLQSDPVYLLADENMTEEEFPVYCVPGLGVGTNFDNVGYVVLTKTRAGNVAYNKWLFTNIMLSWVDKLRAFYKPNTIAMDVAHVGMAKLGLLRVQLALQLCMRPHMIRESFQCSGIFPRDANHILRNCHHRVTVAEQRAVQLHMPELVQLINTQGEIYESDFDQLGILCTKERLGKSLDELILNRRRAVILTHPTVVAKEQAYQAKKVAAEEKLAKKRKCAGTVEIGKQGNKVIKLTFL